MTATVLADAAALVLTPSVLVTLLGFAVAGLMIGAIPGLTATLGVALLIPVTLSMDPITGLAGLMGLAATALYAGDIPGALLRIPGTPASAAAVDAAYGLGSRGQAGRALGLGAVCAVLGGVSGALALLLLAPLLARLALTLSTVEMVWLTVLGLSAAAVMARASPLKGVLSLLIGLAIGLVGLDPVSGQPRLTGGLPSLSGGAGVIPVMIGLFAMPEVIRGLAARDYGPIHPPMVLRESAWAWRVWTDLGRVWRRVVAASGIGVLVGALPGAGADIAAYVARALVGGASDRDKGGDQDGDRDGDRDGDMDAGAETRVIATAGAANNAAIGGALIPAMVLGIPGDSLTAVMIGALTLHGLTPGPTVLLMQPERITAVILAFLLANLLLLPLGLGVARSAVWLTRRTARLSRRSLAPVILVVCLSGALVVGGGPTAVMVMLVAGLLGLGLEAASVPLAPLVLGLVLGPRLEEALLTSLLKSGGDPGILLSRPGAVGLALVTLAVWSVPIGRYLLSRAASPRTAKGAPSENDAPF